jgi:hypothetical protein
VVFAALTCACAASRVSLAAIVRWRRAVAALGDLAAVPADVRRVVARRVVLRRFAGLRGVVVVVFSAIAGISPLR